MWSWPLSELPSSGLDTPLGTGPWENLWRRRRRTSALGSSPCWLSTASWLRCFASGELASAVPGASAAALSLVEESLEGRWDGCCGSFIVSLATVVLYCCSCSTAASSSVWMLRRQRMRAATLSRSWPSMALSSSAERLSRPSGGTGGGGGRNSGKKGGRRKGVPTPGAAAVPLEEAALAPAVG